jgi:F420H(2)-dependent quinone reductase
MLKQVVNPIVRSILRSSLHGILSRSLMLITYTGRLSDRAFTIPVMYAQRNGDLLVYVGHHERKSWWRNLLGGAPVHARVRGADLAGVARVVDGEPETRERYLARFPRAARALDADADPIFVHITSLQVVESGNPGSRTA